MIQPQIMVRNAHFMEGDFLGVFKEAIWPPNIVQPLHVQDPVLLVHIFREPETRISPGLGEKYVGDVSLKIQIIIGKNL